MKFRKKPVEIEAVQFNGWIEGTGTLNLTERPDWLVKEFGKKIVFVDAPDTLMIKTLEGEMLASKGDWIIKGINGELYPCKPDIFEKTYTPVSEPKDTVSFCMRCFADSVVPTSHANFCHNCGSEGTCIELKRKDANFLRESIDSVRKGGYL